MVSALRHYVFVPRQREAIVERLNRRSQRRGRVVRQPLGVVQRGAVGIEYLEIDLGLPGCVV